jgi:hypothetical protein
MSDNAYKPKNTFIHDSLGITIIVGRDVDDSDAKLVIDKLIGITKIFKEKKINFSLSDAFSTLLIVASLEERNLSSPNGSHRWAGFYRRSQDLITIDIKKSKKSRSSKTGQYDYVDFVLVHEIAHAIHLKYISQGSKESYDEITNYFLNQIETREEIIDAVNNFDKDRLEINFSAESHIKNFIEQSKNNRQFFKDLKDVYNNIKPLNDVRAIVLTHLVYGKTISELEEDYFEESTNWEYDEQFMPINQNYYFNKLKVSFNDLIYKFKKNKNQVIEMFNNLYNSQDYKVQHGAQEDFRDILKNIRLYYLEDDESAREKAESLFLSEYSDVEEYFYKMPDDDYEEVRNSMFYIEKTEEFKKILQYFISLYEKEDFNINNFSYTVSDVMKELDQGVLNDYLVNKEIDARFSNRNALDVEKNLPESLLKLYKEKYQEYESLYYRHKSNDGDLLKDLKLSTFALKDIMPSEYGLTNENEDFAENFSLFILNPDMLDQWNINRLVNLMTRTRAAGKTVMQAHKNPILNRYVKLIIEKILN